MKKAVVGIVFDEKNRILLIKRRDVPIWAFPGGGVELKETTEKAIVREILEETGLTVKILRKAAEYSPINHLAMYTECFVCQKLHGTLLTGEETEDLDFFPICSLPSPFFSVHASWLKDALMDPPRITKRPLYEVTYFKLTKYFLQHPIQVVRFFFSRLGCPLNSKKNNGKS